MQVEQFLRLQSWLIFPQPDGSWLQDNAEVTAKPEPHRVPIPHPAPEETMPHLPKHSKALGTCHSSEALGACQASFACSRHYRHLPGQGGRVVQQIANNLGQPTASLHRSHQPHRDKTCATVLPGCTSCCLSGAHGPSGSCLLHMAPPTPHDPLNTAATHASSIGRGPLYNPHHSSGLEPKPNKKRRIDAEPCELPSRVSVHPTPHLSCVHQALADLAPAPYPSGVSPGRCQPTSFWLSFHWHDEQYQAYDSGRLTNRVHRGLEAEGAHSIALLHTTQGKASVSQIPLKVRMDEADAHSHLLNVVIAGMEARLDTRAINMVVKSKHLTKMAEHSPLVSNSRCCKDPVEADQPGDALRTSMSMNDGLDRVAGASTSGLPRWQPPPTSQAGGGRGGKVNGKESETAGEGMRVTSVTSGRIAEQARDGREALQGYHSEAPQVHQGDRDSCPQGDGHNALQGHHREAPQVHQADQDSRPEGDGLQDSAELCRAQSHMAQGLADRGMHRSPGSTAAQEIGRTLGVLTSHHPESRAPHVVAVKFCTDSTNRTNHSEPSQSNAAYCPFPMPPKTCSSELIEQGQVFVVAETLVTVQNELWSICRIKIGYE
eukprot:gene20612-27412_t